ncbi:MAG: lamin tail domain-containing protein [Bacteroidota bacterium]
MKKYISLSIITALLFSGCVKDEQVEPTPPQPVDYSGIVINELCPKDLTDQYFVDDLGDGADWIELYNNGTKALNLAGLWVTDAPGEEAEYIQIPATDDAATTIPPKGYLVLICGAADANGDIPTSIVDGKIFIDMGLSSSGDNFAAIYDPEKAEIDVSEDFNGMEDDKSFGRLVDAGSEWSTLAAKTPGASNDGSAPVAGALIINEFMCSNDNIPVPGDNGDFPDWIEIYNTGDTPIDMGGWYATDDLEDMLQYQLPTDDPALTTVPAHGYLVLYCDGLGEGLHTSFKLGSGGEAIGISEDGVSFNESYTYCDTGCDLPNPDTDFSAGRNGDGAATWVIFNPESATPPTPMAANGVQK